MTYGRSFTLWRDACGGPWRDYTHHAFVEGMRDGTLPRAAFLGYLQQDYLFLIHFARAWALAVAKAGNLVEMRAASATVHALLHHEMPLHTRICTEAGIPLTGIDEAPENLAYTRYVLETGYSGDFLDLLAALAPCVLGYGEIGARLRGSGGPYSDWIETYGGDDYQQLCRDTGALIDRAVADRLGAAPWALPRWTTLTERFRTATRLEAQFWPQVR